MALVFSPFNFGLDRRLSASPWPSLLASELPFRSMQRSVMPIFSSPFDDLEESVFGHRSVFDVLEAPFSRRRQQVREGIKRRSPHSFEDGLLRINDTPLRTVTKRVCYQRGPDGKVVSETTTSVKNGNEPAKRTVKRRIGNKVDIKTFIEAPKQKQQQQQQRLASGNEVQDFDAEWEKATEGRRMFNDRTPHLPAGPSTASPSTAKDSQQKLPAAGPSTASPSTAKDSKQKAPDQADASPKAKTPKHTYFDVEDWEEDNERQADGEEEEDGKEMGRAGKGTVQEAEQADKEGSPRGEGSLSMMERLQQRSRESSPIVCNSGDE